MKGSIVSAGEGNLDAARRAKESLASCSPSIELRTRVETS
jgi:hypothetical protein